VCDAVKRLLGLLLVIWLRFVVSADSRRVREFTGTLDCLQKTITTEELYGLFNGVQLAVLELVVLRGCHWLLFICMRKLLKTTRQVRLSCVL
jgi:hypothetical protein